MLLHRREAISTDRLIDELWGESPPATSTKTLQVYVSHLRKVLASGFGAPDARRGYALLAAPENVDAGRFEAMAAEGRRALESGDPQTAARVLLENTTNAIQAKMADVRDEKVVRTRRAVGSTVRAAPMSAGIARRPNPGSRGAGARSATFKTHGC